MATRMAGLVAVLALLVLVGCRRPAPDTRATADRSTVAGCWELDVTPGDMTEDDLPSWLAGAGLPTTLVLDTVRVGGAAEGAAPVYQAHSYHGTRRERRPFSAWRPLAADSILVDRPGALAGFTLRLAPDDGGLSGILTSFTDAMEPGQPARRTTPVRATTASCPSDGSTTGSSSAP